MHGENQTHGADGLRLGNEKKSYAGDDEVKLMVCGTFVKMLAQEE